jgi:uncharacterized membrane protein
MDLDSPATETTRRASRMPPAGRSLPDNELTLLRRAISHLDTTTAART